MMMVYRTWTEEELFKIIAFASNTTDPLLKNIHTTKISTHEK